MRDPWPAAVLGSAGVALLLTALFSPTRPPDPAEAAFRRELGRLRALRESRRIPPEGIGDAEYARALETLRSAGPSPALDRAALDRAEPAVLRAELLPLASPGVRDRLLADPKEEPAVRLAALARQPSWETLGRLYRTEASFPGRHLLVLALGETGRAEAVPLLREALSDPDESVRAHAALGLGSRAADPAAAEALRSALDDPSGAVRSNALRSLARGPDGERALREAAGRPALRELAEALLRERGR